MNLRDLIAFADAGKIFSRADQILLAVSGGIDSMVMAHLFHQGKFRFAIAHCNFGLRRRESEDDAEFVRKAALKWKVPFFLEKFPTAACAAEHGISIQMAARDLRYAWFEQVRAEHQFDFIATAHHLDDQVETLLINLIRGTGIAGLHGIPVKSGSVIRPLMFAYRKDIEEYATLNKISYRMDLSNHETKYTRNKIRHEVIPLLCSINPEFRQGLTGSIRRFQVFEQVGEQAIDTWLRQHQTTGDTGSFIEISRLKGIFPMEPYVWKWMSGFGFNETQVTNLLACIDTEARKIFTSPTHRLVKERGCLSVSPIAREAPGKALEIGLFVKKKQLRKPLSLLFNRIPDVTGYEIPAARNMASLNFDKLRFPLLVRKWQPGDAFYPLGMKKKKKLSDFFIDQKFTLKEKEETWLLCSGNDIVWIIGHRIDHRFRVTPATREILSVKYSI
ncbi:MAG: tRNA lysidine(34) synthetase TilS [Bacteroidota bacterium]